MVKGSYEVGLDADKWYDKRALSSSQMKDRETVEWKIKQAYAEGYRTGVADQLKQSVHELTALISGSRRGKHEM